MKTTWVLHGLAIALLVGGIIFTTVLTNYDTLYMYMGIAMYGAMAIIEIVNVILIIRKDRLIHLRERLMEYQADQL